MLPDPGGSETTSARSRRGTTGGRQDVWIRARRRSLLPIWAGSSGATLGEFKTAAAGSHGWCSGDPEATGSGGGGGAHSASSLSVGGVKRERVEEAETERASSTAAGAEDDDDGSTRKKLRLTKEQSALLEDRFKEHSTLNPELVVPHFIMLPVVEMMSVVNFLLLE